MFRRVKTAKSLVWATALMVAFVSSANCLIAAERALSGSVCHDMMAHDENGPSLDETCCPGDSSAVPNASPAQLAAPLSAPVLLLIAVLELAAPVSGVHALVADSLSGIGKPPGTPTYLQLSTFRI
jgi:hypothetical protein